MAEQTYIVEHLDRVSYEYTRAAVVREYQAGRIGPTCRARLAGSDAWSTIGEMFGAQEERQIADGVAAASGTSYWYGRGYDAADELVTLSIWMKTASVILAVVLMLDTVNAGLHAASVVRGLTGQDNATVVAPGGVLSALIWSALLGLVGYILGALVRAGGYALRSTVDRAVFACPFLSDDQRRDLSESVPEGALRSTARMR